MDLLYFLKHQCTPVTHLYRLIHVKVDWLEEKPRESFVFPQEAVLYVYLPLQGLFPISISDSVLISLDMHWLHLDRTHLSWDKLLLAGLNRSPVIFYDPDLLW